MPKRRTSHVELVSLGTHRIACFFSALLQGWNWGFWLSGVSLALLNERCFGEGDFSALASLLLEVKIPSLQRIKVQFFLICHPSVCPSSFFSFCCCTFPLCWDSESLTLHYNVELLRMRNKVIKSKLLWELRKIVSPDYTPWHIVSPQ